jgi:hypothetical protein
VSFFTCKAQIVPLYTDADVYYHVDNSGYYYKDVDNDFNKFEGTWKWESGNNLLAFSLKKLVNINDGHGYTYDILIGEYHYIENGIEKVNTLANINNSNIIPELHLISGYNILSKYNKPVVCNNCAEDERRVEVVIAHPDDSGITGYLILRHVIENGIEKIEATLVSGHKLPSGATGPEKIDVPLGEYVLIKQ